uniref:Uncharacterized protein n=1 Tax=Peronospora matthiolae TaxID=2874970 RepID=A0AAV1USY9_9STRA
MKKLPEFLYARTFGPSGEVNSGLLRYDCRCRAHSRSAPDFSSYGTSGPKGRDQVSLRAVVDHEASRRGCLSLYAKARPCWTVRHLGHEILALVPVTRCACYATFDLLHVVANKLKQASTPSINSINAATCPGLFLSLFSTRTHVPVLAPVAETVGKTPQSFASRLFCHDRSASRTRRFAAAKPQRANESLLI